jgi:hypothetical protein
MLSLLEIFKLNQSTLHRYARDGSELKYPSISVKKGELYL